VETWVAAREHLLPHFVDRQLRHSRDATRANWSGLCPRLRSVILWEM
jgi:hypothetical protein